MTEKWSNKYDKCQNCGTKRFNHRAKGYCTRCYGLIRRFEQVNGWDFSDRQSLKGYPREALGYSDELFKEIKAGFALQIRERLDFLKAREEKLAGQIYGIDIEIMLQNIARKCHVKDRNLFYGRAGSIDARCDMKHKKIFYEILNEIEENIPWQGIDWSKIFL